MTPFALAFLVLSTELPEVPAAVRAEHAEAIGRAVEVLDLPLRVAAQLAELEVAESRLAPWVLDGRCNDAAWRASEAGRTIMRRAGGTCDSGDAVGAWQGHPQGTPGGVAGWTKEMLLRPHDAALAVAREWRIHPQRWTRYAAVRIQAARWPLGDLQEE